MPESILPIGAPVAPEGAPLVGTAQTTQEQPQVGEPQSALTIEQWQDVARKARAEAASYRVRANELEAEKQAADRAKLTKEEQLQAQLADKERALSERERQHQELLIAHAVERAATKVGIVDPDAAVKLMDMSQLEYDSDGRPKNAEKILKDLITSKPYLQGPMPSSGSAANPPRTNGQQSLTFTSAQIGNMQPDEYAKNKTAIMAAYKEGRITG